MNVHSRKLYNSHVLSHLPFFKVLHVTIGWMHCGSRRDNALRYNHLGPIRPSVSTRLSFALHCQVWFRLIWNWLWNNLKVASVPPDDIRWGCYIVRSWSACLSDHLVKAVFLISPTLACLLVLQATSTYDSVGYTLSVAFSCTRVPAL